MYTNISNELPNQDFTGIISSQLIIVIPESIIVTSKSGVAASWEDWV